MNHQKRLVLTRDHKEVIAYPDVNFPLEIWTGNMNEYLYRELPTHYHDVFEFAMVIKGEVNYQINDQVINLKENEAIFINSNVIHTLRVDPEIKEAVLYTIGFPSSLLVNDSSSTIFTKYIQPILYGSCKYMIIENKQILALMNQIYGDSFKDYHELHFLSLLIRLWEVTYEELSKLQLFSNSTEIINEERVKKMMTHIQEHYDEKIGIDDLSLLTNISRNTCFRIFKKYLGKSPAEYILEYRINQAATLLLHSNKHMIDIAMECGFESPSYFGKIFKEKTGMTPLEYRKKRGNNDAVD